LRVRTLELLVVFLVTLVIAASRLRLVERARGMVRTALVHGVLAGKLAKRHLLVIRA
jgi:hypothetical protein